MNYLSYKTHCVLHLNFNWSAKHLLAVALALEVVWLPGLGEKMCPTIRADHEPETSVGAR